MSGSRIRLPRTLVGRPVAACAAAAAAAAAAGVLVLGLTATGGNPAAQTRGVRQGTLAVPRAAAVAGKTTGVTTVATVLRTAPRYARPGLRESGSVPSSWWQRPSVLPVIATQPGWVRVRVAQRPNGTTAWLRASDIRLSTTPYRIVINLATTHLMLYEYGRKILSAPAGVGAVNDPTPTGTFFVAFREPSPGPGYGPFILVTSAHSPDIKDWDGSGDAIIGIHGPLGEDAEIGTTGPRISHGCIRLHLPALAHLASIPPGTPIDIIS